MGGWWKFVNVQGWGRGLPKSNKWGQDEKQWVQNLVILRPNFWSFTDYDHLYIPLTSKKGKFQSQTIFLRNTNPFSIKPTVVQVKISEKNINISSWESLYQLQSLEIGHLMLPEIFPDKITLDINSTDKAVVQCDVPVKK